MANQLGQETSPYLLQHKDNFVHWHPWGEAALTKARAENKPILLSVGYSACHWCHVMAHESFENPEIAGLMNELFVNIKLDREERPDLDAIYQQALAMLGQHGGWPLTMFLTPDGEPFWGGTYFPPESRYGRPGFPDVLRAVSDAWTRDPDKVRQNVDALRDGLARQGRSPGTGDLSLHLLDQGARQVLAAIDLDHGGLKGAPKFPQPGLFDFLLRAWLRTGDEAIKEAVTLTLEHMCQGGIYDHLGGGFMRYSTDERWLVPHFEKMLYDNAQLMDLLTLAWQATGQPLFRTRVQETAEWLLREMVAEGGAFASTLDADSEGKEGRFYVWTGDEIDRLLDADTARWFKMAYDVKPAGNWEGRSILHRNHPNQPTGVEDILADARAVLWRQRETRVRPERDDKVLADWNGLTISALANAAFAFSMPRWLDAARLAFKTVRERMALPDDRLAHSMRFGRIKPVGLLDDLAAMSRAALTLAEITGEVDYLDQARRWVDAADRHHWDAAQNGYFQTAAEATDVIVRVKPVWDAALPSANGVMAEVLAKLWLLTGDDAYRERAEATLAAFTAAVPEQFANMTSLLAAFETLANPVQIVIAGERDDAATLELLRAVADCPLPTRALCVVADTTALPPGHPAAGKGKIEGEPTAYICREATCSEPITEPRPLRDALTPG